MSKLILNPDCGLYERNGKAICNSRQIAEEFKKEHKNVLRDIDNLDCSEEFRRLNFEQSYYKNAQNKMQPEVWMTKDGFIFLVMGYKGAKAARYKESYIQRFNQMELFIKSHLAARLEFPDFTAAILDAHETPKHYHFSNEINMINKIVLGMTAKQFKEEHGLGDVSSIRPYLTAEQIYFIERLQKHDMGLLLTEPDFQKRKDALSALHLRLLKSKALPKAS